MLDVLFKPTLTYYATAFSKLKRGNTNGERAPHKPVLLLAVLECIEAGEIPENRIYITPELVARFKDMWSRYVVSATFKPDFTKPFYHLKGDQFWHLQEKFGEPAQLTNSGSPNSFSGLRAWVDYAYVDASLFALVQQPDTREVLRQVLLNTYFSGAASHQPSYIDTVAQQMLTESNVAYRRLLVGLDEEDIVSRSAVFKRVVPQTYSFTCCVSKMQVISTTGVQMIDACHIIPFVESHDDTITNGLSLCPNLHRAFDRGLFRIDSDYRVRLSNVFTEGDSLYQLRPLEGKEILLPSNRNHHPGIENLAAHSERWRDNF